MNATFKSMVSAAAMLGLFSVLGMGLVKCVHQGTAARISENQRQTLLHSLQALLPPGSYDNDLLADAIEITDADLGVKPVVVYRARQTGQPVAAVFAIIAPDGYSGDIRLLIAIKSAGSLAGVRVLEHKETPGLGDLIDENKSRWIYGFDGLSLGQPPERQWKVKRDGGAFDQFAGASITPRAVVKAVRKSLVYFKSNQQSLFSEHVHGRMGTRLQTDGEW